jgi:hypothetical protein
MNSGNAFKNFSRIARSTSWQPDAWIFYHTIGEFRYACDLQGSLISRATLFVGREVGGKHVPEQTGPAVDVLADFFGDADGRAEMLRLAGIHLAVAGEFFIVGYTDPEDEQDVWQIVAATAIKRQGDDGPWSVNNIQIDLDPKDVFVTRIWRPDPENNELAMSPTRAVLAILGEIHRLTEHVAAQVDSRLAGAGILLMPSDMSLPTPPAVEGAEQKTANTADELMVILQTAMAASIQNRGDASALVPIVVTAPAEAIAAVQHMTFWSELDQHAIELRTEAIRRLALGMDLPPEMLLGMGAGNHWSAWQADESAIKAHSEPLLKLITSSLTAGYLRSTLRDEGVAEDEIAQLSIRADTSEMRLRPNRSKEAMEMYDRGELSGKALLRETGFDTTDAMDDEERASWFLRKVAAGSTTPELVEAALRALKVPLGNIPKPADSPGTTEARPTPSLKDHPVNEPPDPQKSETRKIARDEGRVPSADIARKAALIASAEQVVVRALERAGNKLKNKMQVKPSCAAADIYKFVTITDADTTFLLDDAWAHIPAIAERYAMDENRLIGIVNAYTDDLLMTQAPHTFDRFEEYASGRLTKMGAFA